MNLKEKRELLVFTYLIEKGLRSVTGIQDELEITEDEGFQMENTINELIKEGYLVNGSTGTEDGETENISWQITGKGMIRMKDLEQENYEEKNKIPVYIWAIVIVVAILTFMKLFPRMFRS
jgi:hypothetical protein